MTNLEIVHHKAPNSRGTVVFWPCWLGDFKASFYQIPIEEFLKNNLSLVLYNPPGHGGSPGPFELKAGINGLLKFLHGNNLTSQPLYGVSHSGGCNCLLSLMNEDAVFQKLFLFTPVLDSRRSLFHMYKIGSIKEFVFAFTGKEGENNSHLEIFKNPNWLDEKIWHSENYLKRFDYPLTNRNGAHFSSVGTFLENTLIPGHNVWHLLEKFKDRSHVFVATVDTWFPRHELVPWLQEKNVKHTLFPEGTTHFLAGYWPKCWAEVLNGVNS